MQTARRTLPLLLIVFLLVSCTPTQITADLDAVVGAVSLALPILTLAGVPPGIIALAQKYLESVSVAVTQTAAELASADTGPTKAAKITGYFAAAAIPNLPPGTPATVAQLLKSVSDAVAGFLRHFVAAPGLMATPQAPSPYKLSRGDHQELAKIKQKNLANLATLMSAKRP